jgi:hypothetical protein
MSSIRLSINQMRDENGNSYMPNNSVNQLTNYNMSLGYEIFLNSSNTWSIEGANINPTNYSRTLTANRWHIIPVLRTQDIATTTFLSSYGSSILMMKDSDGNIYYPSFSINQIPTVKVGQAYKIYASNTVSFTNMIAPQTASKFDKSNTLASKAKPMLSSNENVAFVTKYKSTGSSSVLVVEGKELEFGDEIGIFNHLGMVVGSSVVVDTKTPIVIWGDDLQSSAVDGAKDDEILTIKKWSRKENKISTLVFENISDIGKSNELGNTLRYSKDAILFSKVAAVPLGIEFPSDANFAFPNPTADYLNISKELDYKYINLYNLDGRLLSKIERGQTIDMQQYANGIYSLEIVSEVGVTWQKVMKISK